ncbi:heavy metal-associated isoprenylated plant protein 47-like, partial [Olea europaea var. sylvestris]|uniref:heavy metal-associated isoprenylated plant protein 47-like n=1 Tax=Olea europaea var. sylvestris TaxID=158386 RepID=UPI000C1D870D
LQRISIKVQFKCDKCRPTAMKIAAGTSGVVSVAIEGEKKDQVVVLGEGVDAAALTSLLRKKVLCIYGTKAPEELSEENVHRSTQRMRFAELASLPAV